MIKLSFSRKQTDDPSGDGGRASAAFAAYCRRERERLRDAGEAVDEERFQAAMDLVLDRLRALEIEESS